jgi:transposase
MRPRRPRPPYEPQAPFFVGVEIGQQTHYAVVVEAAGTPCLPQGIAFPNTREGYAQLYAASTAARAQTPPAQVTVGCEATGPYWLSLYEALTARGYRVLVLNPLSGKARRGTPLRGTQTATVAARLSADLVRREEGPTSHGPGHGLGFL